MGKADRPKMLFEVEFLGDQELNWSWIGTSQLQDCIDGENTLPGKLKVVRKLPLERAQYRVTLDISKMSMQYALDAIARWGRGNVQFRCKDPAENAEYKVGTFTLELFSGNLDDVIPVWPILSFDRIDD